MRNASRLLKTSLLILLVGACDEHEHDHDHNHGGAPPPVAVDTATTGMAGAGSPALDAGAPDATAATADAVGAVDATSAAPSAFLLVAELAMGGEAIHAYGLPDLAHRGTVAGVRLGNHVGAIALADGRVVTTDEKSGDIVAIGLGPDGRLAVLNRVKGDIGPQAMWGCGDAELRYLAIASGKDGVGPQTANVLKLDDFTVKTLDLPMNVIAGATEELHPYIAGTPAQLFAGVGGELRWFPLADVWAGTASAPAGTLMVETGSHGPVVAHARGRLYFSARAGAGFDGVRFAPAPVMRAAMIPWDVDGRTSGRNGRPRLSWDGRFIYGAITHAMPAAAESWAAREVDFHAADLETGTAKRLALTTGLVPKFQLAKPYAFFANITGSGDFGVLVDVTAGSPTFQQVVARVALTALTKGPKAGEATAGKETRASAITPDGRWAFVSHGGDGKVSVIDTSTKAVSGTISTPTPLAGGGYMIAVEPGVAPVDTCTR
jgi:YVTN family beta-propeller protein